MQINRSVAQQLYSQLTLLTIHISACFCLTTGTCAVNNKTQYLAMYVARQLHIINSYVLKIISAYSQLQQHNYCYVASQLANQLYALLILKHTKYYRPFCRNLLLPSSCHQSECNLYSRKLTLARVNVTTVAIQLVIQDKCIQLHIVMQLATQLQPLIPASQCNYIIATIDSQVLAIGYTKLPNQLLDLKLMMSHIAIANSWIL